MDVLSREVAFEPAYDRRDPRPHMDYGIGAALLRFRLSGEAGAVTLHVATGWYLPVTTEQLQAKGHVADGQTTRPVALSLGTHRLARDGEKPNGRCPLLGGAPAICECADHYSADAALTALVSGGVRRRVGADGDKVRRHGGEWGQR